MNGTTTTRSNKKGQAIDEIWGKQGINNSEGGYLLFNQIT